MIVHVDGRLAMITRPSTRRGHAGVGGQATSARM